jgi:glycosyltransferase involved in cell wall biosynthesis
LLTLHVDGLIFGTGAHGGIRRVFRNLLHYLAVQRDVRIRLYIPSLATLGTVGAGIEVVPYPLTTPLRPGRLFGTLNGLRQNRAVARMWRNARAGVFHSTYYSTSAALAIPQLLTMQDALYEEFPQYFSPDKWRIHTDQKRQAIAAADTVVFPSESARATTARYYPLDDKRTLIIPYAAETHFKPAVEPAPPSPHTGGRPFILFVGRRSGHKNFDGLLRTYARWKQRMDFALLAVGGGAPSIAELDLVRSLGIEAAVRFVSSLSDDELVTTYQAASALVVPSFSEGYGLPVMEGMACGTPIAASSGGALREVGGTCPAYFDAAATDDMLLALGEAVGLDRDSERIRRGIAVSHARRWEHVAEEYLAAYRETAHQARADAPADRKGA